MTQGSSWMVPPVFPCPTVSALSMATITTTTGPLGLMTDALNGAFVTPTPTSCSANRILVTQMNIAVFKMESEAVWRTPSRRACIPVITFDQHDYDFHAWAETRH